MTDTLPEAILRNVKREYPHFENMVSEFVTDRGKGLPVWAPWCLLPMAGWLAIISHFTGKTPSPQNMLSFQSMPKLAAAGTWMYSKGVYSIDPTLLEQLLDSPGTQLIPTTVIYRMPEWCLYVDSTSAIDQLDGIQGFFVHLEHDINTSRAELRFLVCKSETETMPLILHLGNYSITESLNRVHAEALKNDPTGGLIAETIGSQFATDFAGPVLTKLVPLVLYLCSEQPDVDQDREPGWNPYKSTPRKTRTGFRLFPAEKTRHFTVGQVLGNALRAAYQEDDQDKKDPTGRTVRAHLRRGHWHGYWTGKRNKPDEQKFIYHWIHPLIAGG